jgi:hypothetical protein
VGEQVPHLHVLLARGGELGPVPGDRRGQVEVVAVGEDQRAQPIIALVVDQTPVIVCRARMSVPGRTLSREGPVARAPGS